MSWKDVLMHGKEETSRGRVYLNYRGTRYRKAHAIWNTHYPSDMIEPGDVIHHKDNNPGNDSIYNLEKCSTEDHVRIHRPVSWDTDKAWELRMGGATWGELGDLFGVDGTNIYRYFKRSGMCVPVGKGSHITWDVDAATRMFYDGMTYAEIGKELGVGRSAIYHVFIRRGIIDKKQRRKDGE